jgi:hypothetical protein
MATITNKAVAVPQQFSLSYQKVQKSYSAQATGLPPANWTPTIGLSPSLADPNISVSISYVETTPTAAKFYVTGFFNNSSVLSGAALFNVSAGADVDLSSASSGVSGPLIPRNPNNLSPIAAGSFSGGLLSSLGQVAINASTNEPSGAFYGMAYDFSGMLVISGLKRKTSGTGTVPVNVTERVVTYTTTKTYRADDYSLVSTTETSSISENIVSPTLNARSIEAAHNVLSAYPSLDNFGYSSSAVSKDKKDEDIKNIVAAQNSQRELARIIEAKVFAAGGVNSAPASLVATYNAALAELTRLYGVETSRFYQN